MMQKSNVGLFHTACSREVGVQCMPRECQFGSKLGELFLNLLLRHFMYEETFGGLKAALCWGLHCCKYWHKNLAFTATKYLPQISVIVFFNLLIKGISIGHDNNSIGYQQGVHLALGVILDIKTSLLVS